MASLTLHDTAKEEVDIRDHEYSAEGYSSAGTGKRTHSSVVVWALATVGLPTPFVQSIRTLVLIAFLQTKLVAFVRVDVFDCHRREVILIMTAFSSQLGPQSGVS